MNEKLIKLTEDFASEVEWAASAVLDIKDKMEYYKSKFNKNQTDRVNSSLAILKSTVPSLEL